MATGRSRKIVGQTGEYLVAAGLSRRGLIATTFTGNVPHYDIIASDETGRHVSVQVKSSRSASWQFGDIRCFCDIAFDGKCQVVGKPMAWPVRCLIVTFVTIEEDGHDRFCILTWQRLRDLLIKGYATSTCRGMSASVPAGGIPCTQPLRKRRCVRTKINGRSSTRILNEQGSLNQSFDPKARTPRLNSPLYRTIRSHRLILNRNLWHFIV